MATMANSLNLTTQSDEIIEKYRHVISATGAFSIAQEALRASELIPENMSVEQASNDFISFFLENQRDQSEEKLDCPQWCLRTD